MTEARYDAERRQGQAIVRDELDWVWGWTGPAGAVRADRRARFLVEAARLRAGDRCLELGCGTGEFTTRLVESGCDLVAVDISPDLVERCRERICGRAEVVVGNVETGEGLEGRCFDAIVGVSVLHHVNMELCLSNTFSLLVPGGRFAFSEPNMANPQVWAMKNIGFVGRWLHETPHESAFHVRELRTIFEAAGLDVDVCEPYDFLHPATPAPLIRAVGHLERLLAATPLRVIAGSLRIAGRRR